MRKKKVTTMKARRHHDIEARWEKILAKLELYAAVLAESGGLSEKVTEWGTTHIVRFFVQEDGRWKHKSLYIGASLELILRTEAWLADLRRPRELCGEISRCSEFAARLRYRLRGQFLGRLRGRWRYRWVPELG